MLNRLLVTQSLQKLSSQLFPDTRDVHDLAYKVWCDIANDPSFVARAREAQSSFLVPSWQGELSTTTQITLPSDFSYTVVAVDGSQIYPDRHVAGAGCFLLNAGGTVLHYGAHSSAHFFSQPRVCLFGDLQAVDESLRASHDIIDLLREQEELVSAVRKVEELIAKGRPKNLTVLLDGTIIFWPLEGKQQPVKDYFIGQYTAQLEKLYEQRVPCAGYISYPKSKELINLVRLGLCRYTRANCIPCHSAHTTFPCKQVDELVDSGLVRMFVDRQYRTTVFKSHSNIVALYPEHLQPWFCYIDIGKEVVRLELPAWVVNDEDAFAQVCQVAYDQAQKGDGYPVCLAEAHEQAVVKGPDREFFYHLIYKIGIDARRSVRPSQKSIKKRGIGI